MQSFSDSKGREWSIDFSFGNVLRVKKGVDGKAFDLIEDPANLGHRLWCDLGEFYECLWLLIEPQAKAASVTAADFGASLGADSLIDARQKFFEEWKDFFRKLQREEVATALEKILSLNREAATAAASKVKEMLTTSFDAKAKAKIDEAIQIAFGKAQESLELTLALTPGANST